MAMHDMFPLFKYVTGQHGPGPPTRKTNTNINCSSSWSQTVKTMFFLPKTMRSDQDKRKESPPEKNRKILGFCFWLLLLLYSLGLNKNFKALENVAIIFVTVSVAADQRVPGSKLEQAATSKLSKQLSRSPDIIPPPPHSCGKVHRCQIGAVRTASEQNSNSQSYFSLMQGRGGAPLIKVFRFTPIVKLLR